MPDRSNYQGSVLDRLKTNLLRRIKCSNGRDQNGVWEPNTIWSQEFAIKKRYIEFNGPLYVKYLCFDIDESDAGATWMDDGAVRPTMIMTDPLSGRGHVVYELTHPVRLAEPDKAGWVPFPQFYMHMVQEAVRKALRADPANSIRKVTKNPFHPHWRTILFDRTYTLDELCAHLDLDASCLPIAVKRRAAAVDSDDGQRNQTLFRSIRRWAYRNVRHFSLQSEFELALADQLDALNSMYVDHPMGLLPEKEIRSIRRSVSRWVWNHFLLGWFAQDSEYSTRSRPMNLDQNLPLVERQRLAQQRTVGLIVDATRARLRSAVLSIHRRRLPINISSVSRESGCSRNTVSKYWDDDLITIPSITLSCKTMCPIPSRNTSSIPVSVNLESFNRLLRIRGYSVDSSVILIDDLHMVDTGSLPVTHETVSLAGQV